MQTEMQTGKSEIMRFQERNIPSVGKGLVMRVIFCSCPGNLQGEELK